MPSKQPKNQQKAGFTIIEVVLVLAIAGLIFLMVFVALPSLQRSQRNTQRRNDMARLATALENYRTNNKQKLPNNSGYNGEGESSKVVEEFVKEYLNDEFVDPDGTPYMLSIRDTIHEDYSTFDHTAYVTKGTYCDGQEVKRTGNGSNYYTISYVLEGSGAVCIDNGGMAGKPQTSNGGEATN